MALKVCMISLGCSKNQVDAEMLLYLIEQGGFQIVPDSLYADVVLVNTCGFIEAAKQESIDHILELCELKKSDQIKKIIITGCLAQRYKDEIMNEMPDVDAVLGIGSNETIVEVINRVIKGEKIKDFKNKYNLPLEGKRVLGNLPYYSYLKIAEGCSNMCSYCSIPMIRGTFRSRPMEGIIEEANNLVNQGVKEIILVAQDTGLYGEDIYGEKCLDKLLLELCKIEKLKWIRILYCYPERITDKLLKVMANEDKIVKYIDMPMQHVNEEILKNMNRIGSISYFKEHINYIRSIVKDIVIRTTFIVGFPGETQSQFEDLLWFLKEVKLERVGCFTYSLEEGTRASKMDNHVDEDTKKSRAESVMNYQMYVMEEYNQKMVGKTIEVLVEGYDREYNLYFGRSQYDAPEIDGKVFFDSKTAVNVGDFVDVLIKDFNDYDIFGECL